jgi:hypothetical protein
MQLATPPKRAKGPLLFADTILWREAYWGDLS